MRYQWILGLLGVSLSLFLTGCTLSELKELAPLPLLTQEEQVLEKLSGLENFKAVVTAEYLSNKNINTYELIQVGTNTGAYYIEVTAPQRLKGSVMLSDNTHIYQLNTLLGEAHHLGTSERKERSTLLLTNFIAYLPLAETQILASEDETVVQVFLPTNHVYLHSKRLTLDNDTLTPIRLVTYDINDQPRVIVTYREFFYNISIDERLFVPETHVVG